MDPLRQYIVECLQELVEMGAAGAGGGGITVASATPAGSPGATLVPPLGAGVKHLSPRRRKKKKRKDLTIG